MLTETCLYYEEAFTLIKRTGNLTFSLNDSGILLSKLHTFLMGFLNNLDAVVEGVTAGPLSAKLFGATISPHTCKVFLMQTTDFL